jgi:excisionase family DNA binding protein
VTAAERLEVLVGPMLAGAILDVLREELADAPRSDSPPRWLTVDQAADYLGTTTKAIRRRIDRRRLEVVRDGRRVYVEPNCRQGAHQALEEVVARSGLSAH